MGLGPDGLIGIGVAGGVGGVGGVVGLSAKTNVDAKSDRIKRVNFFIVTLFDSLTNAHVTKLSILFIISAIFTLENLHPPCT